MPDQQVVVALGVPPGPDRPDDDARPPAGEHAPRPTARPNSQWPLTSPADRRARPAPTASRRRAGSAPPRSGRGRSAASGRCPARAPAGRRWRRRRRRSRGRSLAHPSSVGDRATASPHAGSRARRGSHRGSPGARRRPARSCAGRASCSFGDCSSAAPRRRGRGSPGPSRPALSAEWDVGHRASLGSPRREELERRAATGGAARRRGESYTRRDALHVYPCAHVSRSAGTPRRKSPFSATSALSEACESCRQQPSPTTTDSCGGPVAQPTMPDAPTTEHDGGACRRTGPPAGDQADPGPGRDRCSSGRCSRSSGSSSARTAWSSGCSSRCSPAATACSRACPGVAKTLAVETLATVVGGTFARIQFTPDLVPADIVGTRIYRQSSEKFDVELGPVFVNFLLADEINRAPAKVQSALLEVMAEQQVSIGGETHRVPDAVPRDGHPEPDRAGGRLPAAGGAARPVPDEDRGAATRPTPRSGRSSTGWASPRPSRRAVLRHRAS